jgi:hypothetical protein
LPDIPKFSPAPLVRFPEPFDDPDWLYELKYDGFRALAYVRRGVVELRSRTDYMFIPENVPHIAVNRSKQSPRSLLEFATNRPVKRA